MFGARKSTDRPIDMEMFIMFDSQTKSYQLPTYAINHLDLVRQLEKLILDPQQAQANIVQFAQHFSIFKIGDFDRRTGETTLHEKEHVLDMHELKAQVLSRKAQSQPVQVPGVVNPT